MRAQKVQKRANKLGFSYPDVYWAMDDLNSELDELQEAVEEEDPQSCFEELGDVLFSAVNVARFLQVDAEETKTGREVLVVDVDTAAKTVTFAL